MLYDPIRGIGSQDWNNPIASSAANPLTAKTKNQQPLDAWSPLYNNKGGLNTNFSMNTMQTDEKGNLRHVRQTANIPAWMAGNQRQFTPRPDQNYNFFASRAPNLATDMLDPQGYYQNQVNNLGNDFNAKYEALAGGDFNHRSPYQLQKGLERQGLGLQRFANAGYKAENPLAGGFQYGQRFQVPTAPDYQTLLAKYLQQAGVNYA